MNKKPISFLIWFGVVLVVLIIAIAVSSTTNEEPEVQGTKYNCDVKNFELSTSINIMKDGEFFAKVKGNIFTYVTDPLTMYDKDGNKVAYAADEYHYIAQDSHAIFVDDSFTCEMAGLVRIWGQAYEIYGKNGDKIADVTFNSFNTSGKMYDLEGNLIAEYISNTFLNDFDVRIYEKCNLDEKTVLMIFCSYYSDYSYDASQE